MSPQTRTARWIYAATIAIILCVLLGQPWFLGGQILEVQIASSALILLCLTSLSLESFRSIRTPVVLSALLMGYVLIQYWNPQYEQQWELGLRIWSLAPKDYIPWLPSSIHSDFTDASPLRFLLIMILGLGLVSCLIQVRSRFHRQYTLPLIVLNSSCIAIVAIIQLNLDNPSILGLFDAVDEGLPLYFATFLYKNHAAAFLNLGLATSIACFLLAHRKGNRTRTNPRWFFLFCAILILVTVVLSKSRFGFLCSLGIVAAFLPIAFKLIKSSDASKLLLIGAGVTVTITLILGSFYLLKETSAQYLSTLNSEIVDDYSFVQRTIAYESGLSMFSEAPIYGWGAGNYRHGFRQFQNLEGEEALKWGSLKIGQKNFFWQHAHNDYLEFLIELGVVGTLILFSIPGYFFWVIFRSGRWKDPVTLMLLAGLASTMVHALIDFPFRNPAVLTTWFAILAIAARRCSKSREPTSNDLRKQAV